MYKKSITSFWIIRNDRMKDFLAENGTWPVKEEYEYAYYIKSKKLFSLLDRYFIQNECVKGL